MSAFLKKYWPVALIAVVLLSVGGWALLHEPAAAPAGKLTSKQQKAAQAQIKTDLGKADASKKKAAAATQSAAKDYQAGQQHEAAARAHHKASKPHAPTPINRATLRAADSLLANY